MNAKCISCNFSCKTLLVLNCLKLSVQDHKHAARLVNAQLLGVQITQIMLCQ